MGSPLYLPLDVADTGPADRAIAAVLIVAGFAAAAERRRLRTFGAYSVMAGLFVVAVWGIAVSRTAETAASGAATAAPEAPLGVAPVLPAGVDCDTTTWQCLKLAALDGRPLCGVVSLGGDRYVELAARNGAC